jgi:hypothetical protein
MKNHHDTCTFPEYAQKEGEKKGEKKKKKEKKVLNNYSPATP